MSAEESMESFPALRAQILIFDECTCNPRIPSCKRCRDFQDPKWRAAHLRRIRKKADTKFGDESKEESRDKIDMNNYLVRLVETWLVDVPTEEIKVMVLDGLRFASSAALLNTGRVRAHNIQIPNAFLFTEMSARQEEAKVRYPLSETRPSWTSAPAPFVLPATCSATASSSSSSSSASSASSSLVYSHPGTAAVPLAVGTRLPVREWEKWLRIENNLVYDTIIRSGPWWIMYLDYCGTWSGSKYCRPKYDVQALFKYQVLGNAQYRRSILGITVCRRAKGGRQYEQMLDSVPHWAVQYGYKIEKVCQNTYAAMCAVFFQVELVHPGMSWSSKTASPSSSSSSSCEVASETDIILKTELNTERAEKERVEESVLLINGKRKRQEQKHKGTPDG